MPNRIVVAAVLAAGVCAPTAQAASLGANLIENGGAENAIAGEWVAPSGFSLARREEVSAFFAPFAGDFSFTGGIGAERGLLQTIDLSAHAPAIDAGRVAFAFSARLQNRTEGVGLDSVTATLRFLDAAGAPLLTESRTDPNVAPNVFDWDPVAISGLVPGLSRSASVELVFDRQFGSSTDAYADALELALSPVAAIPLPAAGPMLLAALAALGWRARRRAG